MSDPDGGDFVDKGTYESVADLGFSGGLRTVTLWLEGTAVEQDRLTFELDPDGLSNPGIIRGIIRGRHTSFEDDDPPTAN